MADKFFLKSIHKNYIYFKGPGGNYSIPVRISDSLNIRPVMTSDELGPHLIKEHDPSDQQLA